MPSPKPYFRDVIGAFLFYFLAQVLAVPLFFQLIHMARTGGEWKGGVDWMLSDPVRPWFYLSLIFLTSLVMAIYVLLIDRVSLAAIWGKTQLSSTNALIMFGMWCIAYPLVLVVNNGTHMLLERWVQIPDTDQSAVEQVRQAFSHPFLYAATALGIMTLVPVIEEILFRGYLQQWLKRRLSVPYSVVAASLTFAVFHFSLHQGWMNVELIAALFTFSLFLGFVREKYESLNAAICLHGIFNGMTLAVLTVQEWMK
jgi:hypothetical protein